MSNQKEVKVDFYDSNLPHIVSHKFDSWLFKNFGKNYNSKLHGIDVMLKVEKYLRKYIPEIKIVRCDDIEYGSSMILLVPHPKHGISVMFIPQTTKIQNTFFLYSSHYDCLMKELSEMKKVYDYPF
jgi:hypothetical protein